MHTHHDKETQKLLDATEQRVLDRVKKEFADMKFSDVSETDDATAADGGEEKKPNGKDVVVAVIDKMNTLFTSGMGLVAALAWNEAVKGLFDQVFKDQNKGSVWAKFGYAFVVTIIIVLVTYRLTKLLEKVKKHEKDEKKGKEEASL